MLLNTCLSVYHISPLFILFLLLSFYAVNIKKAEVWGFITTADLGANILIISGREEGKRRREGGVKGGIKAWDYTFLTTYVFPQLLLKSWS